MSLYQILIYFVIYSFLGWIAEVIYHTVTYGEVENRGMLNGPVCPIYGVGIVGCFLISDAVMSAISNGQVTDGRSLNGVLVFIGGGILATLLEYVTGYVLEKLFHMRWWDYRGKPFNIDGYVCVEFSIIWGFVAVFVVKILHPDMRTYVMPALMVSFGWMILIVIYAVFVIDVISTVLTIRKLDRYLGELHGVQKRLHTFSEEMSRRIGNDTLNNMQWIDEGRLQASLAKAEFRDAGEEKRKELEQYASEIRQKLAASRIAGTGRMIHAFPKLQHENYDIDFARWWE